MPAGRQIVAALNGPESTCHTHSDNSASLKHLQWIVCTITGVNLPAFPKRLLPSQLQADVVSTSDQAATERCTRSRRLVSGPTTTRCPVSSRHFERKCLPVSAWLVARAIDGAPWCKNIVFGHFYIYILAPRLVRIWAHATGWAIHKEVCSQLFAVSASCGH